MKTPSFSCVMQIDRHQLSQVVRNLVSNALKFSVKDSAIKVCVDVISTTSSEETTTNTLLENKVQLREKKSAAHYV